MPPAPSPPRMMLRAGDGRVVEAGAAAVARMGVLARMAADLAVDSAEVPVEVPVEHADGDSLALLCALAEDLAGHPASLSDEAALGVPLGSLGIGQLVRLMAAADYLECEAVLAAAAAHLARRAMSQSERGPE